MSDEAQPVTPQRPALSTRGIPKSNAYKSITSSDRGLNAAQERFVHSYMIHRDQVRAYRDAGYTGSNPALLAKNVMVRPNVAAEIARRTAIMAPKIEAHIERSAKDVAALLAAQAFADPASFIQWDASGRVIAMTPSDQLTSEQRAALAQLDITEGADGSLYIKPKLVDRVAAARDLGRHLGMFIDRTENLNVNATFEEMCREAERIRSERARTTD